MKNPPSLGHFLAVERRAANEYRRNHSPIDYGPDELALAQPNAEPNSLFMDGAIAPPQPSSWSGSDAEMGQNRGLVNGSGHGVPVLFSCMCGQSSHWMIMPATFFFFLLLLIFCVPQIGDWNLCSRKENKLSFPFHRIPRFLFSSLVCSSTTFQGTPCELCFPFLLFTSNILLPSQKHQIKLKLFDAQF